MPANPFNNNVYWIWSEEALGAPRPERDRAHFRTRFFRRTFNAPAGAKLLLHVSGDTEFRFWCNGTEVAFGPGKGDIEHHFYETLDLTPHLRAGANVLSAHVAFYGDVWSEVWGGSTLSRMTAAPGLIAFGILEGPDGKEIETVHSDKRWRVWVDTSCRQVMNPCSHWLGNMEELVCGEFPWGFTEPAFDDSKWTEAKPTFTGVNPDHTSYAVSPHRLIPRMTAPMEVSAPLLFERVCRGGSEPLAKLLRERNGAVRFEPGTHATFLISAPTETTGFPHLEFSGGAGGTIKVTYAESLFNAGRSKPKRGDTSGVMTGYHDLIQPDGPRRHWQPFGWRTFRYIEIDVVVKNDPLVLHDLYYTFTAYPFKELAIYECSDPAHAKVWDICWRTARLCAHETYEDCPYYEQLQYGGDTQVQAMISYYVAGDASLARQWLYQYDWSRTSDGLTRSRYPSRVPQTIPFWSLHWVMAVADYWQHTGDAASIRDLFPGVHATLDYFERRRSADGLVGKLTGWQCADWCPQWNRKGENGVPPGTLQGSSAFVNLMTAVSLDHAAALAAAIGRDPAELKRRSSELKSAIQKTYYDPAQKIYWDTPAHDIASAYTNVWALLADMPCDAPALAERIVTDKSLCQLTAFSNYFAYRALAKVGRYDLAPRLLAPWQLMLEWELTTCPEIPDYAATRSDCHAWSAGPLVEFCREILGVRPQSPGYAAIQIAPKPAGLTHAKGRVPLTRLTSAEPARFVTVSWSITGGRFKLNATTPAGIPCAIVLPDGTRKIFAKGGECVAEGGSDGV